MLKVDNVHKSYFLGETEIKALQGISIEVKKGDFISILGRSGSGKSTLLNLMGGLDRPTKGQIFFAADDLSKMDDKKLSDYRNKHVGFVFQTFNLIPHFTALENVVLPLVFNHTMPDHRIGLATEALEKVEMAHRMKHWPVKLSGGERQRVAIARALVSKPDIILADEPTGNLDSKSGESILDLLIKLNKKDQVSLIVVTHENWIAKKAHKVLTMIDGKLK